MRGPIMRPPLVSTTLVLWTAVLGVGCGSAAEATWPGTGNARYSGKTQRVEGEQRAVGPWNFWYPDGTLQARGEFVGAPVAEMIVDPDRPGESATLVPVEGRQRWWTFWDSAGRLATEGAYVAGLRDELWACWYEDGTTCCTGHFADGAREGYHVNWSPNGVKREERRYQGDRLHGERTVWDDRGGVVWRGEYREGELVSRSPEGSAEPPIHDVADCADRAERGLARCVDVARH